MKFTSIVLGFVSMSSVLAIAQPATNQGGFTLNQLHADMLSLGDQSTSCLNISGTWKGTCEVRALGAQQDQSTLQNPTEMTFVQKGCALIQAEQFGASYLGAVKSESVSNPRGVLSQTGASYWLENGHKLGMNQSYSLVMYGNQGTISIGKVQGDFALEGDILVGKITQNISRMSMSGLKIGEINTESDCRLARQ
ncbi:MAG: hypothetical protein NTV34_02860 [Proteobacteria bacterium]|nr:hypothetical protein [Pseudomonadota bacterium]